MELRQSSCYKLTRILLQRLPYKLHPSASLSRSQQALGTICNYYLTALQRIDEHSVAVDDDVEFDEKTQAKEKQ